MTNPLVNNTFFDVETRIAFAIPYSRQVTQQEAAEAFKLFREQKSQAFFKDWKSRKANMDWAGDEDGKKIELFTKIYPPDNSTPLLIGVADGQGLPDNQ